MFAFPLVTRLSHAIAPPCPTEALLINAAICAIQNNALPLPCTQHYAYPRLCQDIHFRAIPRPSTGIPCWRIAAQVQASASHCHADLPSHVGAKLCLIIVFFELFLKFTYKFILPPSYKSSKLFVMYPMHF